MSAPTVEDIREAGYKLTANATPALVGRCANVVKISYLQDVEDNDATFAAWVALTYLRYLQDVEFGTRTGGEQKYFQNGEHLQNIETLKAECALLLKGLKVTPASDVCNIYLTTQIFGNGLG